MSEIEDRRQRAREAYWDSGSGRISGDQVGDAIETATRVKITDALVQEIMASTDHQWGGEVRSIIEAFCGIAGFEVEQ